MKPRTSWKIVGTQGLESPSSAVSFVNWRRCASPVLGRQTVHAIATARAARRRTRACSVGLPGADMALGKLTEGTTMGPGRTIAAAGSRRAGTAFGRVPYKSEHTYNDPEGRALRGCAGGGCGT